MNDLNKLEKLDSHVFVTKLAGFEHSEYIQPNATHNKVNSSDIPMVQGKNIRNGKFVKKYDWFIKKEISDDLKRSKLTKDCILIPYVGSNLGEVGIFYHEYDCHLASNIAKIELRDDYFNLEYLKYYLQSSIGQKYLFQAKQGSSQPNITMESIRDTLVLDIDKKEQEKIVNVLKSIDDVIDHNYQIINILEDTMNLAYKYYFENANSNKIFNNIKIKDICSVESGYPFSKDSYCKDGKYKLITIKNVQDDMINLKTDNNISIIPKDMPADYLLKPMDILMSLTGNVARVGLMYENNCLLNQRVAIIKPLKKEIIPFVYCLFKSNYIRKTLESMSTGTSQLNLSPIETENLNIKYNEDLAIKFSSDFFPFIEKIVSLLNENNKNNELRNILLNMIMNGQIRVD